LLFSLVFLNGCGGHIHHVVKRGETLYSIGWAYGYDYRQVAKWNRIKPPYYLSPGQRLRVAPPAGQSVAALQEYKPEISRTTRNSGAAPVVGPSGSVGRSSSATVKNRPPRNTSSSVTTPKADSSSLKQKARKVASKVKEYFGSKTVKWRWPTKGRRISQSFSAKDPTRQGLDLSGRLGSPIVVAAPGKVVYAGSGLARYGRLIIVKHNEKYLSAYAYNKKLHVKEGDVVKSGQKIANMGSAPTNGVAGRAKLHFEIRRNGKPVDPLRYLPKK
ncbi:MAG: peptidoglycan DD-metalloendopeptidase family protein, partial [Gammaproteobacteria bacterium]|nr:peptidoglycan DD-metalloendopeptidase family protein [Gammaproteobacteria bacterium]